MEQLMFDIYIAEAMMDNDYQNFSTPEKKEAYIREIFHRHGVTQARWDTTLAWYADRIDVYLRINDSVMARLHRERDIIDRQIALQLAMEELEEIFFPDSHIPRFYSFSTPSTRSGFRFRLDSIEIVEQLPYDEFSFDFSVIGIPPTGIPDFRAIITLNYSDTTIYLLEEITKNRRHSIPISRYIERDSIQFAADSIKFDTLTQLSGFVRLPDIHREFTNILFYDILLGVEPEVYHYEDDTPPEEESSWIQRLWRRIWRNENGAAEVAEQDLPYQNGETEVVEDVFPEMGDWE
jgi:hypothetical protein